jgi:hypothetical protein
MRFIDGLRPDIKSMVLLQRPKTLDTAATLALLQEEVTTPPCGRLGTSVVPCRYRHHQQLTSLWPRQLRLSRTLLQMQQPSCLLSRLSGMLKGSVTNVVPNGPRITPAALKFCWQWKLFGIWWMIYWFLILTLSSRPLKIKHSWPSVKSPWEIRLQAV